MKNRMEIIGNGMVALAIQRCLQNSTPAVIFASGVSDSTCQDHRQYEREHDLLNEAISYSKRASKILVYFSSAGAVYGNCIEVKDENSILNPADAYGLNKVISEGLIIASGVKYLILRASNLVGRNQNEKQLIPYLVNNASKGKVQIYGDATRDLLDVEDLGLWTNHLLQKFNRSEIINMASGISVPVTDILKEIMAILGINANVELTEGGAKHSFNVAKLEGYIKTKPDQDYWKKVLIKYVKE